MKIAEALQERASLNSKLDQLAQSINDNALVQEDETPDLDVAELLREYEAAADSLRVLMGRINMTNCTVKNASGETMTQLLARRDVLRQKLRTYQDLQNSLGNRTRRASRSEIKILAAVKASDIKKEVDRLSKEYRLLDNEIQGLNWQYELL